MSKKFSFNLQNTDLLVCSHHKPLLKMFTGHPDNDKCNAWDLEAAPIHRHVKVQHIKGITNVLADYVSRLRAVDIYHDTDLKDHQQHHLSPYLLLSQ